MTIREILAKLGLMPTEGMTPEQKAAHDAQIAALQAELDAERRAGAQQPAGNPDISAQLNEHLKPMRDAMAELAKTVTTMAEHSKTEQQKQLEAQKAAVAKRYTDHVGELLKTGKVTKAEHDEMVKPDGDRFKRNAASEETVESFVESTARWSTVPGFKPQGEQRTLPNQQPATPNVVPGSDEYFAQLRAASAQEIASNMQS